eukprot:SAG11_NODE_482_length_9072_cov_12.361306_6_plen_200_part_00
MAPKIKSKIKKCTIPTWYHFLKKNKKQVSLVLVFIALGLYFTATFGSSSKKTESCGPNDTVVNDLAPAGSEPTTAWLQMSNTFAPFVASKRISSIVNVAVALRVPVGRLLITRTAVAPAGCAASNNATTQCYFPLRRHLDWKGKIDALTLRPHLEIFATPTTTRFARRGVLHIEAARWMALSSLGAHRAARYDEILVLA